MCYVQLPRGQKFYPYGRNHVEKVTSAKEKIIPWINVLIIIFGDFLKYSAKMTFVLKTIVIIFFYSQN
jgi:hypothetical protein